MQIKGRTIATATVAIPFLLLAGCSTNTDLDSVRAELARTQEMAQGAQQTAADAAAKADQAARDAAAARSAAASAEQAANRAASASSTAAEKADRILQTSLQKR
ncbi:MAG: alanine-zipper protein [Minwuiales bacterium]|nr:alanine-zipper protein [Minwuiales bacterium]